MSGIKYYEYKTEVENKKSSKTLSRLRKTKIKAKCWTNSSLELQQKLSQIHWSIIVNRIEYFYVKSPIRLSFFLFFFFTKLMFLGVDKLIYFAIIVSFKLLMDILPLLYSFKSFKIFQSQWFTRKPPIGLWG